jgi:DNA-binding transcriptional MerR regulator
MRISELSARTGISIPTLKFYLRENLLRGGDLSAPNQADYSEAHVRRAILVRTLREIAGLSIAKIATIMNALDHGQSVYEVMGSTVDSLGGQTLTALTPPQERSAEEIDRYLESLGLPTRPESLARHQLIAAFTSIKELLFPEIRAEFLFPYSRAAIDLSRMEQAATPGMFELEPEQAIEKAILGLALFEPVLLAFRRLAHEQIVHETLGPKSEDPH